MKPVPNNAHPRVQAVAFAGEPAAGGALLHAGPVHGRPSRRRARKLQRRWAAWRLEAFGERVPVEGVVVVFSNYETGRDRQAFTT